MIIPASGMYVFLYWSSRQCVKYRCVRLGRHVPRQISFSSSTGTIRYTLQCNFCPQEIHWEQLLHRLTLGHRIPSRHVQLFFTGLSRDVVKLFNQLANHHKWQILTRFAVQFLSSHFCLRHQITRYPASRSLEQSLLSPATDYYASATSTWLAKRCVMCIYIPLDVLDINVVRLTMKIATE